MQHLWGIFSAKKELKDHKDKHHRITNEKMGNLGFTPVKYKRKPDHRYLECVLKACKYEVSVISENKSMIRGSLESMTISALKVSFYYSNKS